MTYEQIVARIADKTNYKFIALEDHDKKRLCAVLLHEGGNAVAEMMRRVDEDLRCQACKSRIKRLCRYSNGKKPLLFSPNTNALSDSLSVDLRAMNARVFETPAVGIRILEGHTVDGFVEVEGPFSHYYIGIPEDQRTMAGSASVALYNKAIRRYVPEILPRMIRTIIPDSDAIDAMSASLERMRSCLDKATYGRMLLPSVEWLVRVVNHFRDTHHNRMIECARILLWTAISPDGLYDAVSPVIQQAIKNVIPIMADAKNEAAMISMLNDRLSPSNYQRPSTTKEIKPQQVMSAMRTLGDFTNRLMTWEEASRLPGALILRHEGSMQSFRGMMPSKRPAPYTFASRSGISTLSGLVDLCTREPGTRLEIRTMSMSPCYLASTTLDPTMLSVPHLWAFMNGKTPASIGMKQWEDVCGIVRMEYQPHNNWVFVIRDTSRLAMHSFPNCCFPAFLSIQHRRSCRDAFERLNTTMRLGLPDKTAHSAVGIGVSITDSSGRLNKPLTIRVNGGAEMTISSA